MVLNLVGHLVCHETARHIVTLIDGDVMMLAVNMTIVSRLHIYYANITASRSF